MNSWAFIFPRPLAYPPIAKLQDEFVGARLKGLIPDTVLFLEHLPVITLGVRGRHQHVVQSAETLARQGIAVHLSSRGGDVTYHAPGQLVVYPILHLAGREADAREYIHSLEEIAIRTAQDFGIQAFRRSGMPGVWTAQGKIAALGVRFKRWVSSHGLSFNIDLDLTGYAAIIPCGLSQESVTSLQALLGDRSLRLAAVRRCLIRHFQQVFRRKLKPFYIGRDPLPAAVKESMEGACRTA